MEQKQFLAQNKLNSQNHFKINPFARKSQDENNVGKFENCNKLDDNKNTFGNEEDKPEQDKMQRRWCSIM